jgi:catechol 2,3-dioxygenase-like lactoylglutathione lyase family enzyme
MKLEFCPYVAFKVKDYANAIRFYKDVMGLNLTEPTPGAAEFTGGPITFYPEARENPALYFEFKTDNLAQAKAEFAASGCRIEPGGMEGTESCYVHDPYGFAFHLYEAAGE